MRAILGHEFLCIFFDMIISLCDNPVMLITFKVLAAQYVYEV